MDPGWTAGLIRGCVLRRFKVFTLFPLLEKFSRSDHYMRVLFPIAFLSVFLSMFSEVNFGADQRALLATSNCYNAISGQ